MSVSGVGTSPLLQWLQHAHSQTGSAAKGRSCCGGESSSDTTSISQEAIQLNAIRTPQSADRPQASEIRGAQGHHGHHQHQDGKQDERSFIDRLVQSISTDLRSATGSDTASGAGSSDAIVRASTIGGSFLDKLASKIAEDLLATYRQAGGAAGTASQSSIGSRVNATA